MLFSYVWRHLKSHGVSRLDWSYDENIKLRKLSDLFKKSVYVTKMLKVFNKFWHHVKIGLEQGFYV